MEISEDIWSEWLKIRRFGGDAVYQKIALDHLKKLASKIIEKAKIYENSIVLDIGTGDGLIGLVALSKLGPNGKLIFSDISEAALTIPKSIFKKNEIQSPSVEFLIASIDNLSAIPDNSIDRVVMRAVLLYVENKQGAFNEIFRILRKGGIAVLMEPINQRTSELRNNLFRGYRLDRDPLLKIKSLLEKVDKELKVQNPQSLLHYTEHDLVNFILNAGFEDVELEYSLIRTSKAFFNSSKTFFDVAPNPHAITLRDAMRKVLNSAEYKTVETVLEEVIKQPSIRINSEAILILEK